MSFIAVVRMQGGSLVAIMDDDKLAEWPTEEAATEATDDHILAPLGIEIVEVQA